MESVSLENESVCWKPQQGTIHSTKERKERRNRTSLPHSTEVAVSIICRGPLWLPKSIIILIVSWSGSEMAEASLVACNAKS